MAHIDALVDKISDPALRQAIRDQVDALLHKQSFGLVYQSHKPETVQLPNHVVKRGSKVKIRHQEEGEFFRVEKLSRGQAEIVTLNESPETTIAAVSDLVVVREFGEPIYAGLRSVGRVDRGGNKPSHVVINAENFHALQALLYTHEGAVDAIYIDPPYNNGARTWKYNNDYVDSIDEYRHSKWLSFMEKRLRLSKRLLRTDDSVLIVTIDENEVHRLALLLAQVFPGARIQMITSVINPKGASLGGDFARVEENIFFVYLGTAQVTPADSDMLNEDAKKSEDRPVKWSSLIRGGAQGIRTDSPGAFYPVFIDVSSNRIHSFGEALPWVHSRETVSIPDGTVAVWPPVHTSGAEGRWGIGPEKARELYAMGALRLGKIDVAANKFPMSYLSSGIVEKITSGEITVVGRKSDGTLQVRYSSGLALTIPRTVWRAPSHNAGEYGSKILTQLLPGRRFPFPKSLYAVEDSLRFFLSSKPDAVVLDFFGGSGTTAHAVARLNKQDDGQRQSIIVTNNEVSEAEAKLLREQGFAPGDPEWEALGIANYITNPRLAAAITGKTPQGADVKGEYKFRDEGPLADGFEENLEFFELTYEDPDLISLGRKFEAVAPLLWLKAGGRGPRVDVWCDGYAIPEGGTYGVLFDADAWRPFVDQLTETRGLSHVFVVTDSESVFQEITSQLPTNVASTQLYSDYLRTFEINTRGQV